MAKKRAADNPQVTLVVNKIRNGDFINSEELETLRQSYRIPDEDVLYPQRVRRDPQIKIIGETLRRFKK